MGRVTNRGLVRMEKDGVSQDFVLSSVPVWEKRGWKIVAKNAEGPAPTVEHERNERLADLRNELGEELDTDAKPGQTTKNPK